MTRQPSVAEVIEGVADELRARLARGKAELVLDLTGRAHSAEEHLRAPLATVLLVLAQHHVPGRPFVVRTVDRAGGDTEVVVEGVELPEDFPDGVAFRDLWGLATRFLEDFHRVRIGRVEERVFFLVPGRERANALRRRAEGARAK